jgi:hypothetical protein
MSLIGNRPGTTRKWFALAVYSLTCIVYTWPLARYFNTRLLGIPFDNYELAWLLWWWKYALFHGHNPFFTRLVFSPHGLSLIGAELMPAIAVPSIPVQMLAGFPATYNILVMLCLVAGAFLMYVVATRWGLGQAASVLAGFVFGFAPVVMIRALGHLNLAAVFQIPLVLLALTRIKPATAQRWVPNGLWLGSAFAAAAYVDVQTAFYLLPLLLLWFLREFLRADSRNRLRLLMTATLGALWFAALFSPVLLRLFALPFPSRHPNPGGDLAAFVTPSSLSTFFRHSVAAVYKQVFTGGQGGQMEEVCYLGWTALALAIYGAAKLYKKDSNVRWWCWVVIVYLVLACGDDLRIWGQPIWLGGFHVRLPFHFLGRLPILAAITEPTRFVRLAMPGIALLAAYGYQELAGRMGGRKQLAAWVCFPLVLLDFSTFPFPLSPGGLPPIYQSVAQARGPGGTLYLPLRGPSATAEWPMAKMDMPLPTLNFYVGTHYRPDDWQAVRECAVDPMIRTFNLWEDGKSLPEDAMEGLRFESQHFINKYQIGRIAVLKSAATPRVLQGLRFIFGVPGQPVGSDYLFETSGNIGKTAPPLLGENAPVVAAANLLLVYDSHPELQARFPEVRSGNTCGLDDLASVGLAGEPSLVPYQAIYKDQVISAKCSPRGVADVNGALLLFSRSKVLARPEKYRQALLALRGVYALRLNLRKGYPDWSLKSACGLAAWAASSGVRELPQYLAPFAGDYDALNRACSSAVR